MAKISTDWMLSALLDEVIVHMALTREDGARVGEEEIKAHVIGVQLDNGQRKKDSLLCVVDYRGWVENGRPRADAKIDLYPSPDGRDELEKLYKPRSSRYEAKQKTLCFLQVGSDPPEQLAPSNWLTLLHLRGMFGYLHGHDAWTLEAVMHPIIIPRLHGLIVRHTQELHSVLRAA